MMTRSIASARMRAAISPTLPLPRKLAGRILASVTIKASTISRSIAAASPAASSIRACADRLLRAPCPACGRAANRSDFSFR
jgi:hypothetical protein